MKARMIGGIIYFILFCIALFTKFHLVLFPIFLIIGLYEIFRMQQNTYDKSYVISYSIIFVLGMLSLYYLTSLNAGFVFYVSILIMLNDTMAYFVGKQFGRHKLSSVSPNKTIEGSIGGIFFGVLLSNIVIEVFNYLSGFTNFFVVTDIANATSVFDSTFELLVISIVITVFGQIGDLLESRLKRTCKIKDSGNIVYGHGGILDRLDSLVLAILFMALYLS